MIGDPGAADELDGRQVRLADSWWPEPGDERGGDGRADEGNGGDERARELAAECAVDEEAGEGKQRDQPEIDAGIAIHSFIRLTWSTFRVWRVRKMAMMMARPRRLRSGDDHDEEDEDLAADLVPHVGEGDEGEVDGVEHELNRHEDGDDVALDEERGDADGEEDGGEDEIAGQMDGHLTAAHRIGYLLLSREHDGAEDGDEDQD